jgi:hypothetical protein
MNIQNEDQKIIALLKHQKDIMPSEDLLRSTLHKLPSPQYRAFKSPYLSLIQKFSLATVAIVVIAGGGVFYAYHYQSTMPSAATVSVASGNSNAALNSDLNAIDTQLAGLSTDTAAADQALNKTEN